MKRTLFITTASWEPRFVLGAEQLMKTYSPSSILYFWVTQYAERTLEAREHFEKLVAPLPCKAVSLSWEAKMDGLRRVPAHAIIWRKIYEAITEYTENFDEFVLDISTMPRETIWIVLDLLTTRGLKGVIAYHPAAEHGEWCGWEPEEAHIVPKLGGVAVPEATTKLLIVAGYDQDRSEQFIKSYEPTETLILCQRGVHAENLTKNIGRHKERFGNKAPSVSIKEIDCYVPDWGFQEILREARAFGKDSNLMMASLGPKPSAVALFLVHRVLEQSSLVYAPCRDYNQDYSSGIKGTISLQWSPTM